MAGRPTGISLIGGGRWARVIASVLTETVPPGLPVTVCSPGNPAGWSDRPLPPGWTVCTDLGQAVTDTSISHVVIARRARDHAGTALPALRAGKRVLIEKPFCLSRVDLEALLDAAPAGHCQCGLVQLHASYMDLLSRFAPALGSIHEIRIEWTDPFRERRHGEVKGYDLALNVVQDVMPHVWSLLRRIDASAPISLRDIRTDRGGREMEVAMQLGENPVRARLARDAERRQRRLTISATGGLVELDFTDGNAVLWHNGLAIPLDAGAPTPLAAELIGFLSDAAEPLSDIHACAETVLLGLAALAPVRAAQRRMITQAPDSDDARYALREIATGGLSGDGSGANTASILAWLGIDGLSATGRKVATAVESLQEEPARSTVPDSNGREPKPGTSRKLP